MYKNGSEAGVQFDSCPGWFPVPQHYSLGWNSEQTQDVVTLSFYSHQGGADFQMWERIAWKSKSSCQQQVISKLTGLSHTRCTQIPSKTVSHRHTGSTHSDSLPDISPVIREDPAEWSTSTEDTGGGLWPSDSEDWIVIWHQAHCAICLSGVLMNTCFRGLMRHVPYLTGKCQDSHSGLVKTKPPLEGVSGGCRKMETAGPSVHWRL